MKTFRYCASATGRQQSGVVLLIALIALVALTLAGVGIINQVSSATSIVNNLSVRQHTVSTGDAGLDMAVGRVLGELAGTASHSNFGDYYYSTAFTQENPASPCTASDNTCIKRDSVPNVLRNAPLCSSATYAATTGNPLLSVYDNNTGNCATIVVERMCNNPDVFADESHCMMLNITPPDSNSYTQTHRRGTRGLTNTANYVAARVTVRIDGVRGSSSYMQGIVAIAVNAS